MSESKIDFHPIKTKPSSVTVTLAIDQLPADSEPGIGKVRATLSAEGERQINLTLNLRAGLVRRALLGADREFVKYAIALLLVEWLQFHHKSLDARAIKKALLRSAGVTNSWPFWTGLAGALAKSQLLAPLDKTSKLFEPSGATSTFLLFSLKALLLAQSDIPKWQQSTKQEVSQP
jgi:hypothetical protein